MTKTPDPIQELVTAARRKQILDAATQVFAEKGFHRATIKDIARVAGIADRHVPHEGIDNEVHGGAGEQSQHPPKRLTS